MASEAPSGGAPLLELRQVGQTYGGGPKKYAAIEDINLAIRPGEFVALVGPSGCGKSTLLRIITGLQRPTSGEVLYRSAPLEGVNEHATIVFQSFALFPWLSVQGNVEKALQARGVGRVARAARAVELLDRVGLDGFETAYPRELSGGMRQKVGFARAMAVEPELLCLDEPFSALDVLSAESLRGELLELWVGGKIPTKAILMVTHNIEEAVLMAGRIVVMDKQPGRIIADRKIDLPHPRDRKAPQFLDLVDRLYALLTGETLPEHLELGAAPGEAGRVRALPDVAVADLAGFVERLSAAPKETVDVYKLSEELRLDTDRLLRLVEAAELLGFGRVARGDIALTPLGEAFADASILTRKTIFATRIRRLPLFQWLLTLLQVVDEPYLSWEDALTALEVEFPPADVERQLEIIVRWGRYAEILAYDDTTGRISLERASEAPVAT
jgi:NitT/TauT family transport system ATP-binding protein